MPELSQGVRCDVYKVEGTNRIVVAPIGHWTIDSARPAIDAFRGLLSEGPAHFVGDCRRMDGYDGEVRAAWQQTFLARRGQILSFTFVGVRSSFIRMGIAAMSLFVEAPMKTVAELDGLRALE